MADGVRDNYVAECFWPGVDENDLRRLDRSIAASVAAVTGGPVVRYLGWLFVVDDEVVLVLLAGPEDLVRRVAEHAGIPFGRILRVTRSSWPALVATDEETVG